jgi:hypothetical protein
MSVLRDLLTALLAVTALIAPFALLGRRLTRQRHRDGLAAVAVARATRPVPRHRREHLEPPLDGTEIATWKALNRYEALVGAAYESAAIGIGDALSAFVAKHGIDLPAAKPQTSVEIALLRLRVGIREAPWAYRLVRSVTDTSSWGAADVAELANLLAA